jgi:hypothetical protein
VPLLKLSNNFKCKRYFSHRTPKIGFGNNASPFESSCDPIFEGLIGKVIDLIGVRGASTLSIIKEEDHSLEAPYSSSLAPKRA